jgi:phospho-N-acetylmuramoyl-pentapeptide-transferase
MLHLIFITWLKTKFILFNLLNYITFRSLAAFLTAFLLGVFIAPPLIRRFRDFGIRQAIRKDGPESHQAKSGTPTMGGIIVIIAALVAILLWTRFNYYVMVVTLGMILFGLIGFIDDFLKVKFKNSKGITSGVKLVLQILFSLVLITLLFVNPERPDIFWKFFIPFYNKPLWVWQPVFGYIFYIFVLVAFSNATNLTDGLDGLASGMGILLFIPFAVVAYVMGNAIAANYLIFPYMPGVGELAVIMGSLIGGFTAFLWYNTHPAQVFMGDTGSLCMGGVIALIAIILKEEMLLVVAGGMFVLETLSVAIQLSWFRFTKHRYGEGRRVFLMAPIHHHFEKKGWKETQVVTRFWILSALFAILAISSLKIR